MRDTLIEWGLVGVLLLVVIVPMIQDGNAVAAVAFVAFLLVPYGFGRILWSKRSRSDWLGWGSMAVGVAILAYLQSGLVAAYAGLVVLGQIIAALLARAFYPKSDD